VIDKVSERYGWAPRVTLDQGLRDTIRWFTAVREERVASGAAPEEAPFAMTNAIATPS
jgi:dTDP-D-glucose 4,6-dehydratase